MKESNVKIFGIPHIHENTSIEFTEYGMIMSCGLNITNDVYLALKTLPNKKGKLFIGKHRKVYKYFMPIQSIFIGKENIIKSQKYLLKLVQTDINLVK